jgi:hypothetical protein
VLSLFLERCAAAPITIAAAARFRVQIRRGGALLVPRVPGTTAHAVRTLHCFGFWKSRKCPGQRKCATTFFDLALSCQQGETRGRIGAIPSLVSFVNLQDRQDLMVRWPGGLLTADLERLTRPLTGLACNDDAGTRPLARADGDIRTQIPPPAPTPNVVCR